MRKMRNEIYIDYSAPVCAACVPKGREERLFTIYICSYENSRERFDIACMTMSIDDIVDSSLLSRSYHFICSHR